MNALNLDELFIVAEKLNKDEIALNRITIEGGVFLFTIHIEGDGWDKKVDSRIAKYIIDTQKAFDKLYKDILQKENTFKLKAEIKEGSNISIFDITEMIKPLVANMTTTQTFIASMTAIAAVSGYFFYSRYKSSEDHKEQNKPLLLAIESLKEVALKASEKYKTFEDPIKNLIKNIEDESSLSIGEHEPMPIKALKKLAPSRSPRRIVELHHCDNIYQLYEQNDSSGETSYSLSYRGIKFKAKLDGMTRGEEENFINKINEKRLNEELPISIPLQIDILHKEKEIKSGLILGMDAPRENKEIVDLEDLLN